MRAFSQWRNQQRRSQTNQQSVRPKPHPWQEIIKEPIKWELRTRDLQPIMIDASNIAMAHGREKNFH